MKYYAHVFPKNIVFTIFITVYHVQPLQIVIARIPDAAPYRDKVESSGGVSIFDSELRNVIEMSTDR